MEFEYYTDEIVLNSNNINNKDSQAFNHFIQIANGYLLKMGINPQDIVYFYKRNNKGKSVLGIQLQYGDVEDLTNYLVFDSEYFVSGDSIYCSIDMHASSKISSKALEFAHLGQADVKTFFEAMEKELKLNGETDVEQDYMKKGLEKNVSYKEQYLIGLDLLKDDVNKCRDTELYSPIVKYFDYPIALMEEEVKDNMDKNCDTEEFYMKKCEEIDVLYKKLLATIARISKKYGPKPSFKERCIETISRVLRFKY